MWGYDRISEGTSPRGTSGQAKEPNVRTALRSSGAGRAQVGGTQRRKLGVAVSLGVVTVFGVLLVLSLSGGREQQEQEQQQQQQDDTAAADFGSRHAGTGVDVYETSLHTGTRLDRGFPSPAGLKQECTSAVDMDDDSSSSSSEDSSSSGSSESAESSLCPRKGEWGTVVVETEEKLQTMIGFGGAFTDAATINFFKMPEDVQEKVLDAYFGPNGIEYSVGRIPMGSCDFSVETYSFDDVPGDYNLTHFDDGVKRDTVQRIPMLLEALERRPDLQLFISPWSPPAWMKVPKHGVQSMIESASPQGLLPDPRVHAAWAHFFSRFISAYKAQGVELWGLTIQNESENGGPWEACIYTPSSQADFIRDYLGPVIRRDHPDMKIMAFDHNRDHLVAWAKEMMRDDETSQYLDGMGFHWYVATGQRLMDGSIGWGAVNTTHGILSEDKFMLSTESCNCPNVAHSLEDGWKRAEHVAHDMIAGVNSWSTGWIDWNLMLDYDGGPNHAGNLCDSPVVSDKNHTDVIFQPMFYYLGHMSKFAQPGSRRLKSHVTGVYQKGGGGPSTVIPGYEGTLYGCEGSVRQSWELSATGKVSLADYYGAEYDWFEPVCLSRKLELSTQAVTLVPCDSSESGIFVHDRQTGHLVLQEEASWPPSDFPPTNPDEKNSSTPAETPPPGELLCLDVLYKSTEDGAVVTLTPCALGDDAAAEEGVFDEQKWEFSKVEGGAGEGSLRSVPSGRCLTAGWPFFTGAAFEMSDDSKARHGKDYAVVLLNEAEEPVEYDLAFPSERFTVRAMIGPRSIQTVLA